MSAGIPTAARERLLEAAAGLFYERGINATGIDLVIEQAGVAKATLYNNFTGKDALVVAYLERLETDWVDGARSADDASASPAVRLDLLFEALCDGLSDGTFYGCPFANAVTELPNSQPVRDVAMRHRGAVLAHVVGILGVGPESKIANRIVLLYDGAIVSAKVTSACDGIDEARQLVRELVDSQSTGTR